MTELREVPDDPALHEAAAGRPGEWVYDIDWAYSDDQRTPPEAIRGGWEVGIDGLLTGRFMVNPRHRPIRRSDRPLPAYLHVAAVRSPGQWISEIDPRGESRFPDIPDEMIRGWWHIGPDGIVTDAFRPNSRWIDDGANGDD